MAEKKMIRMRPGLQKWLRVVASTKTIFVHRSDTKAARSVYKALSAESSTKHGLGPSFFVYAEFGEARNDELWNTMYDGHQAVASPLAVVISTQNQDPQHPLSQMIDDGLKGEDPTIVCHLHAADDDCDLDDRVQWIKANPALKTWKSFAPIVELLEQEMNSKLFGQRNTKNFVEFNIGGLARGDFLSRMNGLARAVQTGLRTPNETRAYDNLPPLPFGDDLLIQGATIPLKAAGQTPAQPTPITEQEPAQEADNDDQA